MSTNDVPGANPANRDELAMGAWAEHADGSLILVESTEAGRVIYSLFDTGKTPIVEWRDAMAEGAFKKTFSWKKGDKDRWTWHDKTAFPWDRIIKAGARDGARHVSADEQISEAERVRKSRERVKKDAVAEESMAIAETAAERVRKQRELQVGRSVDPREIEARMDQIRRKAKKFIKRMQDVIDELKP